MMELSLRPGRMGRRSAGERCAHHCEDLRWWPEETKLGCERWGMTAAVGWKNPGEPKEPGALNDVTPTPETRKYVMHSGAQAAGFP